MKEPLLTVCTPTLLSRAPFWSDPDRTIGSLALQIEGREDVEFLALADNAQRTVGWKRQHLSDMASGAFIVHLDDDDWIAPDYVEQVVRAIERDPSVDCIVYETEMWTDGVFTCSVRWGIHEPMTYQPLSGQLSRKPFHILPVARRIWRAVKHPDVGNGGDWTWARKAWQMMERETRIDAMLYRYMKRSENEDCAAMTRRLEWEAE